MDYIVNLYHSAFTEKLKKRGFNEDVVLTRVLSPQKREAIKFIRSTFSDKWASEAEMAFSQINPTIFVALKGKNIVGFSCYNATAKGYFGPIGVDERYRKEGIGEALTLASLEAMKNDGYGYAIIGSAKKARTFYTRFLTIEDINSSTESSIYDRMF